MNTTKLSEQENVEYKIVKVKIEKGKSQKNEYYFRDSFTIGRSDECSVILDEGVVSRVHLEVINERGKWMVTDKYSSNGSFLNGNRIDRIELKNAATIVLGKNGPVLLFTFEEAEPVFNQVSSSEGINPSVTSYIKRYFDDKDDDQVGQHTRMMREAFKVVKKKQTSRYIKLLIAVGLVALVFGAYAVYQNIKENKQKLLAENIFYEMKALELEISALKTQLANSGDESILKALEKFDERRSQMQKNYNHLVQELGIYDLREDEKLIIHMARIFGECELTLPKEFLNEVKSYVNKWKSSDRLIKALERAEHNGYIPIILGYLARQQLPYQFFYLALQESDFRDQVVGPQTRYGFAKGIWQFIPATAQRYGLRVGPLSDQSLYDPGDERFNFPKATNAAARYIRDIYNTDAQASGLLVMASYNWGEGNIINLIRRMPENPRDRNFWNLLINYRDKFPDETYNYVFYIFSAAVICENPRLFGFNFDNPLKSELEKLNMLTN
jgi:membrane-bound lytic murein transglycosylase D